MSLNVKMDSHLVDIPNTAAGIESSGFVVKHSGFYIWKQDQWHLLTTEPLHFEKKIRKNQIWAVVSLSDSQQEIAAYMIEPQPLCKLFPHAGSDRGLTWRANIESSVESPHLGRFAIRFDDGMKAGSFKNEYTIITA